MFAKEEEKRCQEHIQTGDLLVAQALQFKTTDPVLFPDRRNAALQEYVKALRYIASITTQQLSLVLFKTIAGVYHLTLALEEGKMAEISKLLEFSFTHGSGEINLKTHVVRCGTELATAGTLPANAKKAIALNLIGIYHYLCLAHGELGLERINIDKYVGHIKKVWHFFDAHLKAEELTDKTREACIFSDRMLVAMRKDSSLTADRAQFWSSIASARAQAKISIPCVTDQPLPCSRLTLAELIAEVEGKMDVDDEELLASAEPAAGAGGPEA